MRPILFSVLFLVALTIAIPANSWGQRRVATSGNPEVEQIYVAHAVRLSRVKATGFCDEKRIGPGKALWEDRFDFRSIKTRPSDGRMLSSDGPTIGNMHVCFGTTTDAAMVSFYAEGTLAKIPFTGKGECLTAKREFPEPGLTTMRCFLDLQGLSERRRSAYF